MSDIRTRIAEQFEDAVFLDGDGFDEGIVGVTHDGRVVYCYETLVGSLSSANDGWTEDDAVEWLEFNTIRSLPYAGDRAPVVMHGREAFDD